MKNRLEFRSFFVIHDDQPHLLIDGVDSAGFEAPAFLFDPQPQDQDAVALQAQEPAGAAAGPQKQAGSLAQAAEARRLMALERAEGVVEVEGLLVRIRGLGENGRRNARQLASDSRSLALHESAFMVRFAGDGSLMSWTREAQNVMARPAAT